MIKIEINHIEPKKPQKTKIAEGGTLEERVVNAIKSVFDPELPVNVYDLGLIYRLDISADGKVDVDMTLTNPNCPVADVMPNQVRDEIAAVKGVSEAKLQLVWEPKWDKSRLSEAARLELGLD